MKWSSTLLSLMAWGILFAGASPHTMTNKWTGTDTSKNISLAAYITTDSIADRPQFGLKDIETILAENKATRFVIGHSRENRKIYAYYFPGTSDQRALVIAGVHGSELSAVEVAGQLLSKLAHGESPFYSVIIVPSLFPDNAVKAMETPGSIGAVTNIGRYTFASAVDPNRQMPTPGKAFDEHDPSDHLGRTIEKENQFLLQLIQVFRPQRIASIHAIRNMDYGGVYADPRTDEKGMALGYSSDRGLALAMADYIQKEGGNVNGNKLEENPTALYYKDPEPVAQGQFQKRNMTGSSLNAKRGSGISLGTWASTAIAGEEDPSKNREAMRIITIEYPGYKRSMDYSAESQQLFQQRQVEAFADAIQYVFLGSHFPENEQGGLANN